MGRGGHECRFNQKDKPTSNTTVKLSLYITPRHCSSQLNQNAQQRQQRTKGQCFWQQSERPTRINATLLCLTDWLTNYSCCAAAALKAKQSKAGERRIKTKTGKALHRLLQICNWFMPDPTVLLMNLNEYHLQMNHCSHLAWNTSASSLFSQSSSSCYY